MEEIPNTSVTLSAGPTREMWQTHQATIKKLYLHEHRTLKQGMQIMKRDYGLDATEKMYKRRLTLWRMDNKNLRKKDVKHIALRKVERDAVGKRSQFFIKGREIDMENVYNYLKKTWLLISREIHRGSITCKPGGGCLLQNASRVASAGVQR